MNAPSEMLAAARALDQRVAAALRPAHAAAVDSLVANDPAGQHFEPFITVVAPALAMPVPRQLYRTLVWRYWLLALSLAIACWWTMLALL